MKKTFLLFTIISCFCTFAHGFALLSHQAIIDAAWKTSIKPLLIKKYPDATETQLKEAYSYLYGGALMPDIGYSPFGSIMFTNLMHYVRSGDFVMTLLDEAKDINEYAFGLGFLCHYQADKYGHSLGTNLAVPILFPKLKEEHGDTVSYEMAGTEHTRVEFGFDVIQTAKGNYDLEAKNRFVGFKISEPVLERAFFKTYGMELKEIFSSLPIAVETFRFAVKQLFPELTKNAWRARNNAIMKLNPTAKKKSYQQKFNRKEYNKNFGRPGLKSILFSVVLAVIPKIGPTAGLKYKEPDERVDKIFDNAFDAIVIHYTGSLEKLESDALKLENINFDTGKKSAPGTYKLEDDTNFLLLKKLKRDDFKDVNKSLKKHLVTYYSDPAIERRYKDKKAKLRCIKEAVVELNAQ